MEFISQWTPCNSWCFGYYYRLPKGVRGVCHPSLNSVASSDIMSCFGRISSFCSRSILTWSWSWVTRSVFQERCFVHTWYTKWGRHEVAGMAGGEKLFWPSGYTSSVTDLWHGFNSHLWFFNVLYVLYTVQNVYKTFCIVLYTDCNQYTKRTKW